MGQVDIPISEAGGTVTAVDGGALADWEPIITINTTAVKEVETAKLMRTSLIFPVPTEFGQFKQPINWLPESQVVEEWGTLQYKVAGKDITYFRDIPVECPGWISNEPNGDAATQFYFPQISWLERPVINDIWWLRSGADVDIILHRPDGSTKVLFEGIAVGFDYSGKDALGVTLNCVGVLYQADHTPYIQELYEMHRDSGTAIADIMDGTISRHFAACNRPFMDIPTNIRGSGGKRLTGAVQDVLSVAYTADAYNQWTITNLPGRRPYIKLKDRTTHHWEMDLGNPGLDLKLTDDFVGRPGMVWGSGIAPDGCAWYNAKYPGIRVDSAPAFPLSVGATFVAGDADTGFDEFADEMRTRGYTMYSGDTYVTADVAEVRDFQARSGITVDGIVGAQTWNGLFGVGGTLVNLAGAHIAPLAAVPWNLEFRERADGTIIGPNPYWDPRQLAVGRVVQYGEGVSKAQGVQFARQEIASRLVHDPTWVGSATLTSDPRNGSRWEMREGENLWVRNMYEPKRFEGEGGLLLHISQANVKPGGDVSLSLSYLGDDMTTLASIMKNNKDNMDPARRRSDSRSSRSVFDNIVPWDCEAGGGKIPLHNLQGGFWTVYPIQAAKAGTIVDTRFICGTGIRPMNLDTAFDSTAAVPGAKDFYVAIFSKRLTANKLDSMNPNPNSGDNQWTKKADEFKKMGILQAYGSPDSAAGYWPEAGPTKGDITGKMRDTNSWSWESQDVPYLWVAEWCASSTKITGQLRNGVRTV